MDALGHTGEGSRGSLCVSVELRSGFPFPPYASEHSSHVSNGSVGLGKPAHVSTNPKAPCTWRGKDFRPVSTSLLAVLWQVATLPHPNEHLLLPPEQ